MIIITRVKNEIIRCRPCVFHCGPFSRKNVFGATERRRGAGGESELVYYGRRREETAGRARTVGKTRRDCCGAAKNEPEKKKKPNNKQTTRGHGRRSRRHTAAARGTTTRWRYGTGGEGRAGKHTRAGESGARTLTSGPGTKPVRSLPDDDDDDDGRGGGETGKLVSTHAARVYTRRRTAVGTARTSVELVVVVTRKCSLVRCTRY